MDGWATDAGEPSTRGASPVVAVVLLVGIVAISSVGILVATSDSHDRLEQALEVERAQQSLVDLSKELDTAATSRKSRQVDLSNLDDAVVDPDAGWVSVAINVSDDHCTVVDEQPLGAIVYEYGDTQVAYQGGGVWRSTGGQTTIVSSPRTQLSVDGDDELTVALPITSISGDPRISGQLAVDHAKTERKAPSGNGCEALEGEPVVDEGRVEITVQSTYYEGWGRYFERETGHEATYDHDDETMTVVIVDLGEAPAADGPIRGAIWSDAESTQPANDGAMDSYDSSVGPYSAPGNDNANILVTEKFAPTNDVEIKGDVLAGGDADISNRIRVTGDVIVAGDTDDVTNEPVFGGLYATGGYLKASGGTFEDDVIAGGDLDPIQDLTIEGDLHVGGNADIAEDVVINGSVYVAGNVVRLDHSTIDGDVHVGGDATIGPGTTIGGDLVVNGTATVDGTATIGGTQHSSGAIAPTPPPVPEIPELESVAHNITDTGTALDSSNNNSDTSVIASRNLEPCPTPCTLEAGSYYLEEIDLYDESLVFDTTDGDIEVYVEGIMSLGEYSEIEVVGDGRVEVYLDDNFDAYNTRVSVGGDRAPQFWVYMAPRYEAKLKGTTSFTGVIYGPGFEPRNNLNPNNHRVQIYVSGTVEVYGALVGHIETMSNSNKIHFDEALFREGPHSDGEQNAPDDHLYLNTEVTELVVTER